MMNNFKLFGGLILSVVVITACATSKGDFDSLNQKEESMLIELNQPDSKKYDSAKVYVSSVKKRIHNGSSGLLITGQFSNGCSSLMDVSHQLKNPNNTVSLSLKAWQPGNAVCTQQLVPFSYLYSDLPKDTLKNLESYEYQNETHEIN